jgi:hypothetical protein
MEVACGVEHELKRHEAGEAAADRNSAIIDCYVADSLESRIIENSSAGMVLEALGEETDLLMDAFSPALIAFMDADMSDDTETTGPQDIALIRLGWFVLKIAKKYNCSFSSDELKEEANKEFYSE